MIRTTLNSRFVLGALLVATCGAAAPSVARAQNGYYAAIAYSQSTGKIGSTARQARTEQHAKQLALANCGAPDAKVFTWARDQWVAIAVIDNVIGTAGFARGLSADEAQRKALAEVQKRAKGRACRVSLCVHSSGMQPRQLLAIPRDPKLPPATSSSGFVAAIAFSPSTGKIGRSSGEAKTKAEAEKLALKSCGAPDAKVFMWSNEWAAIAIAEGKTGVAGFGPGATRKIAEEAALAQCRKYAKGAPCRIALAIHSADKPKATTVAKPVVPPTTPAPATTESKPATPPADANSATAPKP